MTEPLVVMIVLTIVSFIIAFRLKESPFMINKTE